MVENPYPLGGDFAEAWGEGAAAERERVVKLLRAEGAARAGGTAADYWADFIERSAPSPSPPEPPTPCPACGGSGDRNGNLRASDPFGTCPGCDGRGIREAVSPSPPEPAPDEVYVPGEPEPVAPDCGMCGKPWAAPDVDAIIERLRSDAGLHDGWLPFGSVVAAVREAAAPSPPDTDERRVRFSRDEALEIASMLKRAEGDGRVSACRLMVTQRIDDLLASSSLHGQDGGDGFGGRPPAVPHGRDEASKSSPRTWEWLTSDEIVEVATRAGVQRRNEGRAISTHVSDPNAEGSGELLPDDEAWNLWARWEREEARDTLAAVAAHLTEQGHSSTPEPATVSGAERSQSSDGAGGSDR